LALRSPWGSLLPLALKSAIFGGLVFLGYSSWILAFFAAAWALFLYAQPMIHAGRFIASFIGVLIIPLFVSGFYGAVLAGVILFLLLGAKNLAVIRHDLFYYTANGLLLFSLAFLYMSGEPFASPLFNLLFSSVLFFFLFREMFSWASSSGREAAFPYDRTMVGLAITLLSTEVLWVLSFLPFRPLYGALLSLLTLLILEDFLLRSAEGRLSRFLILRAVTGIVLIFLVAAAVTDWSP